MPAIGYAKRYKRAVEGLQERLREKGTGRAVEASPSGARLSVLIVTRRNEPVLSNGGAEGFYPGSGRAPSVK